jgi:FHA domain
METIDGVFCPVCKQKNQVGATICVFCNTPLEKSTNASSTTTKNVGSQKSALVEEALSAYTHLPQPTKGVAIYIEGTSKYITTINADNIIIGRYSEKTRTSANEAFVDLEPYGALEMGLSRRHLMIQHSEHGYEAIDLGSTNGTYLKNERMVPKQPYPLSEGNMLMMGKMHVYIIVPSEVR